MIQDYKSIWEKWLGFLQSDFAIRKEVLDALHIEVRQGFTVIAKVSIEELEHTFSDKTLFQKIQPDLEAIFLYMVWCGYLLFLVEKGIDPVESNLVAQSETNELGNRWMEEYEKDKCASLLLAVDPVLSLFLQNGSQTELQQLLAAHTELADISYKDILKISSFLNWVMHQGFLLAMLEQDLIGGKEKINPT